MRLGEGKKTEENTGGKKEGKVQKERLV